ncbi:hypothetical protein APHCRT_0605 [Anaplasma phagocytophilum str. CRT53-1]|uniref:Uncharacterized protein n=1 Tax=Anaplasma phagocytophilum str. CRT53-1 TaxID=1359157 RepID=A0A0F3Q3T2_ANAPH|nr:hypothetical protein APHCRT_0605 [Anaplasma phagocytophilum str. CRT53-1]
MITRDIVLFSLPQHRRSTTAKIMLRSKKGAVSMGMSICYSR